jgi:hypothetical protein
VFTQYGQDFGLASAGKVGNRVDVALLDATFIEELHIVGAEGEDRLATQNGAAQKERAKDHSRNIFHPESPF